MSTQGFWTIQDQYHAIHSGQWPSSEIDENYTATAAWRGGGSVGGSRVSSIDSLTFSTETTAASPAVLTITRNNLEAANGNGFGWFGGGWTGSTSVSTMDRLSFSTQTVASSSAVIGARSYHTAASSPGFGWFAGGGGGPRTNSINKLNIVSETTTLSPATLSAAKLSLTGTTGNGYGWFAGGSTQTFPSVITAAIDKINLAAEVRISFPSTLSSSRQRLGSTTGAGSAWISGGFTSAYATPSTIDKLTFSTETRTLSSAVLTTSRTDNRGASGGQGFGWFNVGATTDKLNFSSETLTLSPSTFSLARGVFGIAASQ